MRRNNEKKFLRAILKIALSFTVISAALVSIENVNIDFSFFKCNSVIQAPPEPKPGPYTAPPPVTNKNDDDNKTEPPTQEITKPAPTPPDLSTIKINHEYSDSLIKREDINTHTFTLNSPCGINIIFKPHNKDEASYKLAVKDTAGRTLADEFISSKNLITQTGSLYLRNGTYTLEIKRGESWNGEIYKFSVNSLNYAYSESEDNDSESRANHVPLNQDIHASTGTADDVDYFIFTLNNLSSVRPEFKFTPIDSRLDASKLKLYTLTINGLNTGETREFTFRGDSTPPRTIEPFTLRAGSYLVSVSREKRDGLDLGIHEYTFRINAQ